MTARQRSPPGCTLRRTALPSRRRRVGTETRRRRNQMGKLAISGTRLPAVSVVIAAFADERWDQLCDAIASIRSQTAPVLETVVVIDHNPALLVRARGEFTDCTVIANARARGASGARNTGAAS